jgi:hypothetical protein
MEHELRRRGEDQKSYQLLGTAMMAVRGSRDGQCLVPRRAECWVFRLQQNIQTYKEL